MHCAEARAPFLDCSPAEACSPDPVFCQSKRESDEAAADRSNNPLGRRRLARPAASTAKELRQLALDVEVILPKPCFFYEKNEDCLVLANHDHQIRHAEICTVLKRKHHFGYKPRGHPPGNVPRTLFLKVNSRSYINDTKSSLLMIYRNMHCAEARAPFLDGGF